MLHQRHVIQRFAAILRCQIRGVEMRCFVPVAIFIGDHAATIMRQHFVTVVLERLLEIFLRFFLLVVLKMEQTARRIIFGLGRQQLDGLRNRIKGPIEAPLLE